MHLVIKYSVALRTGLTGCFDAFPRLQRWALCLYAGGGVEEPLSGTEDTAL